MRFHVGRSRQGHLAVGRPGVPELPAWLTGSAGLLAARSSVICGMCNNLNYAHESENCQPGKTDWQAAAASAARRLAQSAAKYAMLFATFN